jgi:hypothetical protein
MSAVGNDDRRPLCQPPIAKNPQTNEILREFEYDAASGNVMIAFDHQLADETN